MSAHTPGPWAFRPSRQPQITSEADTKGRTVAIVVDHFDDAERDANAHLIASAPDLLAGARQLLRELDTMGLDLMHPLSIHAVPLRDAVAKAEGRS